MNDTTNEVQTVDTTSLTDALVLLINSGELDDALEDVMGEEGVPEWVDGCAVTFQDAGVLTNDAGLVITFGDGSAFQLTIVRSR